MAEKLFILLNQERERLEMAIAKAEECGEAYASEVRRLRTLHRAVNEQIDSWMRDLHGDDPVRVMQAA